MGSTRILLAVEVVARNSPAANAAGGENFIVKREEGAVQELEQKGE